MSKLRLFFYSLTLSMICLLAVFYLKRARTSTPRLVRIASDVFITSQLRAADIPALTQRGLKTVVDIRPDGEASDQASAAQIEAATVSHGMAFRYAPVPHDTIPESAVEAVEDVLQHAGKPAVLYCRSGRRAARTFALAEASQSDGPAIETILATVRTAGFSVEDLRTELADRISRRNPPPPTTNPGM